MTATILPFRKPPVVIMAYSADEPPADRPSRHLLHPLMSPDAYRVVINRALRVATGGSTNITEIRQAIDLMLLGLAPGKNMLCLIFISLIFLE